MVGLLDLSPIAATVVVRGQTVEVVGISAKGVAHLLARFPELGDVMSGKTVEVARLMEIGGDCVAAIIAAGCGLVGNAEAEERAGSLSLEEQADFLTEILKLTMPGGVGPFVAKLTGLGLVLNPSSPAPGGKDPDTRSRKPSKA